MTDANYEAAEGARREPAVQPAAYLLQVRDYALKVRRYAAVSEKRRTGNAGWLNEVTRGTCALAQPRHGILRERLGRDAAETVLDEMVSWPLRCCDAHLAFCSVQNDNWRA
jgi:hypothetical protein